MPRVQGVHVHACPAVCTFERGASTHSSESESPATLKSSSCRKGLRLAISDCSAGGYCPEQYHEPGASQMRLAGSAIHFFDLRDTFMILKMRTLPYLDV